MNIELAIRSLAIVIFAFALWIETDHIIFIINVVIWSLVFITDLLRD